MVCSKVNVLTAVRIGVGSIVVKILLAVYIWVLKCTPPVEFWPQWDGLKFWLQWEHLPYPLPPHLYKVLVFSSHFNHQDYLSFVKADYKNGHTQIQLFGCCKSLFSWCFFINCFLVEFVCMLLSVQHLDLLVLESSPWFLFGTFSLYELIPSWPATWGALYISIQTTCNTDF